MTAPSTFILIRHGESEGLGVTLAGRKPGVNLTPAGLEQARKTARYLRPHGLSAVYTSPRERTLATAGPLADACQVPLAPAPPFDEFDFGDWSGLRFADLDLIREWKLFNQFRSVSAAPGGESLLSVQTRALRELLRLAPLHQGQTVAVVTHSDVIRALIAFFAGVPLDLFLRFRIDPASISTIELAEWGPSIQSLNETAHLGLSSDMSPRL